MRSVTILLVATGLAACSSSASPDAAKPGDVVLQWDLKESDRASIRSAELADHETFDLHYQGTVTNDAKIDVEVHLKTAKATFEEDGKTVTHAAPVKLSMKVVDAKGFALSKPSCSGPHYTLDLPPASDMILHCVVRANKPNRDVSFSLYAYGDGHIDDGGQGERKAP
ncbi:MAG: hypothetical protein KC731_16300 [Myxococcales bacterium]|nr:hypothetical protein [Myxococcales bacterium]